MCQVRLPLRPKVVYDLRTPDIQREKHAGEVATLVSRQPSRTKFYQDVPSNSSLRIDFPKNDAFNGISPQVVRLKAQQIDLATEAVEAPTLQGQAAQFGVPPISPQVQMSRWFLNKPRPKQKLRDEVVVAGLLRWHGLMIDHPRHRDFGVGREKLSNELHFRASFLVAVLGI